MKKILFIILSAIIILSCKDYYIEDVVPISQEEIELNNYLDAAIRYAYNTHLWMLEENSCEELECCWEYVPYYLKVKYENGNILTIEEKELIISGIQSSPSYLETLDESDEFTNLYYFKKYGSEYFNSTEII